MNPYDKINNDKKCNCNPIIIGKMGPKGEKGDKGDKGDTPISSSEGVFFSSYDDTGDVISMSLNGTWLVPDSSDYFTILNNTEIEVVSGIYEINLSGIVSGVDITHGGGFYLVDSSGSAIKDLTFELSMGNVNLMYFGKSILFRFEKDTILLVKTNITGDVNTSNVMVKDVTLFMRKIHE